MTRPIHATPSGRDVSDLNCPHCDLWIGDPDDAEIRDISIVHDVSACGNAENDTDPARTR